MERSTRVMLVLTTCALAVGGIAWWADQTVAANWLWAGAAVGPLVQLAAEIVEELRRGRPGVDVIAVLAISGALILGEFLTAAVVGLMLATGRYLDAFAAGRAERELTDLLARAPRSARRLRDGEIVTIPLDEVSVGDRLLVTAGETVPVDGAVASGPALLDEAALTGESLPVTREAGDIVASGAVNAGDSFEIRAVAIAAESTYAGIIRLVEAASSSQAPVARLADRWAGWFIPVTLVAAAAAWIVSADPMRALAVLVVATPCPLLLAVPIAIVSGVSRAAKRGVIFRGGAALERVADLDSLVVDKTGTLTVGEPTLRELTRFVDHHEPADILRWAASVEQASTHLLARSLVAAARQWGLGLVFPDAVAEHPGKGISGRIGGHDIAVGTARWLVGDQPEPEEVGEFRRRMQRLAPLSTFVAVDGVIVAAATFDDSIRGDAAATIRALKRAGVDRVVMATGDHEVVAHSVGLALGVDQVLAECTPAEKVSILDTLEGTTGMVGDGINDAPALAAADVGIAMGARGASGSAEAADVVLVVDRLQRLVEAMAIAQRSRRVAVQSVAMGMGLSLVAMGFAFVGLLAPIAGAIAQEFIDVAAILNALRALRAGNDHPTAQLRPELVAKLRAEHDELIPRLEQLRTTADRLDHVSPADAQQLLDDTRAFLVDVILPHEAEDERTIYPELAALMPGDDPMAAMSRTHREIFHLIDLFGRVVDDLPPGGPEPADLRDLRRLLYGLDAVLKLHFEQEEELYASLDEGYQEASGPDDGARVA